MWKKLLFASVAALALTACSDEEATEPVETKEEPTEETAKEVAPPVETEVQEEAVGEQVKEEKAEEVAEPVEPAEETAVKVELQATEITYEDFNGRFKQDTEETQYPNGKFQLGDGSTVNADYLFYAENDVFDYAMAIFADGKLADIQIETPLTMEELQQALGISFDADNISVEPYAYGYELNFDERFHENNIAIYPNEWD